MEAYCVKCRSKKEMKNAKAVTMKNGKLRWSPKTGQVVKIEFCS